jgi:hypothetical protein
MGDATDRAVLAEGDREEIDPPDRVGVFGVGGDEGGAANEEAARLGQRHRFFRPAGPFAPPRLDFDENELGPIPRD